MGLRKRIVAGILTGIIFESNITDWGTFGENLTWRFENGVLTISGKGKIPDYGKITVTDSESSWGFQDTFDSKPWNELESRIRSIIIEPGITGIGVAAFSYSSAVNVVIPASVTSIGNCAFKGCSNLTNVRIPDRVVSIGAGVFASCTSLSNVIIRDGITSIRRSMFDRCANLSSITIPKSVVCIEDYAFNGCERLTDIYYGGSRNSWSSIERSSYMSGDDSTPRRLENAVIHYNSTGPEAGNSTGSGNGISSGNSITTAVDTGIRTVSGTYRDTIVDYDVKWNAKFGWDYFVGKGYRSTVYNNELAKAALALSATIEDSAYKTRNLLQTLGCNDSSFQEKCISSYMQSRISKSDLNNIKFFITGHSLGGACANIVARDLSDKYGGDNVFAYTFAAPGPFGEARPSDYPNIHNVLCYQDHVPLLNKMAPFPRKQWYGYGRTAWFDILTSSVISQNYFTLTESNWYDTYNANNDGVGLHSPSAYLAYLVTGPNPYGSSNTLSAVCYKCPVDVEVKSQERIPEP